LEDRKVRGAVALFLFGLLIFAITRDIAATLAVVGLIITALIIGAPGDHRNRKDRDGPN